MVRLFLNNHSHCTFNITSLGLSEIESEQNFWNLDAEIVPPKSATRVCRLDVPDTHGTDSEVYLSVYLWDGEAPLKEDREGDSALVVRVKVRRGLCVPNSMAYEVCSIPSGALMPPSFWQYGKGQVESLWFSRKKFYTIKVKRKGFNKLSLEVHDEDPRRHHSRWEWYVSFIDHIDRPVSLPSAEERAVAADAAGSHQTPVPDTEEQEEIYENEHKNHLLGHARYSKSALGMFDRPAWTDYYGRRKPAMDLVFLPSPCWRWTSEWQVDIKEHVTDEEGWMYSSGWNGEWKAEKSFGKTVRRRRWVRTRAFARKVQFEEKVEAVKNQIIPMATLARFKEQLKLFSKIDALLVSDILEKPASDKQKDDILAAQKSLNFLNFKLALLESLEDQQLQAECLRELGRHSPRFLRQAAEA